MSIEYALIRDVNDQGWRADLLGKQLHGARVVGPRQPDPAEPDPGQQVGRQPQACRARVRAPGAGPGGVLHGARYPRQGDRGRMWTVGGQRRVVDTPGSTSVKMGGASGASRDGGPTSRE